MRSLAESSLQRLRNWDISEEELQRTAAGGQAAQHDDAALAGGRRGAWRRPSVQGMRFMPGEALYSIADLSSLWLLAEVFEQDLALGAHRPGTRRSA